MLANLLKATLCGFRGVLWELSFLTAARMMFNRLWTLSGVFITLGFPFSSPKVSIFEFTKELHWRCLNSALPPPGGPYPPKTSLFWGNLRLFLPDN